MESHLVIVAIYFATFVLYEGFVKINLPVDKPLCSKRNLSIGE